MPAEYYDKVLYPIQNKVIGLFKDTPFYLSGGTALSRSPLLVAKILFEFDYSTLDTEIKWVEPVDSLAISGFLTAISEKIVRGGL